MNIKFMSYNGKWPNLCSGHLTLDIDGKIYQFGYDLPLLDFWRSGGCATFTGDWEEVVTCAPWIGVPGNLPEWLRPHVDELMKVFNENVPFGCCGGCL